MNIQTIEQPNLTLAVRPHLKDIISLLSKMISTRSYSGEERGTADLIQSFLADHSVPTFTSHNNVWAYNRYFDLSKPTILLNSHHDTVRPNSGYTRDPFDPLIEQGRLYGLGSNDAGGCLVSLIATFLHFFEKPDLPFNLCLAATAEEEISGEYGFREILPKIKPISFAIVGEPTNMDLAIAEPGCMVLDCISQGRSGHAARNEGDNAIYGALADIQWFSTYTFPKESCVLEPIKMTVTEINAGLQSNVVPSECRFTVDIRFCNTYTVEEIFNIIKKNVSCTFSVRPGILMASCTSKFHPIVRTGVAIGRKTYISPTSSDQGWLSVPSIKMGPGDSARSHTSDEYIYINEIKNGIAIYTRLLDSLMYYLINNPQVDKVEILNGNS